MLIVLLYHRKCHPVTNNSHPVAKNYCRDFKLFLKMQSVQNSSLICTRDVNLWAGIK